MSGCIVKEKLSGRIRDKEAGETERKRIENYVYV